MRNKLMALLKHRSEEYFRPINIYLGHHKLGYYFVFSIKVAFNFILFVAGIPDITKYWLSGT